MIFDRILEDTLGFIRRLLWWRSGQPDAARRPFQSMKTISGENGLISLVEGRDTPRAVRSWIYSAKHRHLHSAKPVVRQAPNDLHIYLDFLGPLPGGEAAKTQKSRQDLQSQRQLGKQVPSHRLQILKASHFLNEHGFYDYELLFWSDFDFYGPAGPQSDDLAILVVDRLAHHCLQVADPFDVSAAEWTKTLDAIWQETQAKRVSSAR